MTFCLDSIVLFVDHQSNTPYNRNRFCFSILYKSIDVEITTRYIGNFSSKTFFSFSRSASTYCIVSLEQILGNRLGADKLINDQS